LVREKIPIGVIVLSRNNSNLLSDDIGVSMRQHPIIPDGGSADGDR
jgi:hypothetical protein